MCRLFHFASLDKRSETPKSAEKQNKEQEKLLRLKTNHTCYAYINLVVNILFPLKESLLGEASVYIGFFGRKGLHECIKFPNDKSPTDCALTSSPCQG